MTLDERTIVLDEEKLAALEQEKKKRRRVGRLMIFWRRFSKSKVGLFGLVLIVFIMLLAIFAPFIAGPGRLVPYDPEGINLPAQYLPPFSNEPEALTGTFPIGNPSTAPNERTVAGIIHAESVEFINGLGTTSHKQISQIDTINDSGTERWTDVTNPGTFDGTTGEIQLTDTIFNGTMDVSYRVGGKIAFQIRAGYEKILQVAIKIKIEQESQASLWEGSMKMYIYDNSGLRDDGGLLSDADPLGESKVIKGETVIAGGTTKPKLAYFSFGELSVVIDQYYWIVLDADITNVVNQKITQSLLIAVDNPGRPLEDLYQKSWNAVSGWNVGTPVLSGEGFVPWFEVYKETDRFHILGTDALGRDILSVTIWGARASLTVAFVAITIQISIGVILGSIAGYFGGKTDNAIMRITDLFLAVPTIFLLMIAITIWEKISLIFIAITIGFFGWSGTARIVRAEFLSLREMEYADAAKALGVGNRGIIFKHLLPNAMAPVIVTGTLGTASAILIEAGLSFLGFGDPSAISWGTAIQWGMQGHTLRFAPWVATIPGLAIFVAVMSFNLFGDALRDALDPRLKS